MASRWRTLIGYAILVVGAIAGISRVEMLATRIDRNAAAATMLVNREARARDAAIIAVERERGRTVCATVRRAIVDLSRDAVAAGELTAAQLARYVRRVDAGCRQVNALTTTSAP